MNKRNDTKELLLANARNLFWSKGYSNVSVREISKGAGVDVALIARYFDSKLGLFEATLTTLQRIDAADFQTPDSLIDTLVEMYASAPKHGAEASPISMILLNANDSAVGEIVARAQYDFWQRGLEDIIGDKPRAALFFAALMGFSVAQKSLNLDGIAEVGSETYRRQLRHVLSSALMDPSGQ